MTVGSRHKIFRLVFGISILFSFLYLLSPFLIPILVAGLLAFAVDPIVSRSKWMKKSRGVWTALLIGGLFVVFTTPIVLVSTRLVSKVKEFSKTGMENTPLYASLKSTLGFLSGTFSKVLGRFNLGTDSLPDSGELLSKGAAIGLKVTGGIVSNLPDFILGLFIFTVVLYFFLAESKNIKKFTERLDILSTPELNQLIKVIQRSSYTSFVSTVIIGLIQAAVVTIGAAICGFSEFLIVFVLTFFVALIPVIGAAPVAFILAVVSFTQSENASGIGLVVTAVIAGTIDNVIKPILINSSDDDLHPVIALVTIVGAVIAYGMPGLILGPILTQLVIKGLPILFKGEQVSK